MVLYYTQTRRPIYSVLEKWESRIVYVLSMETLQLTDWRRTILSDCLLPPPPPILDNLQKNKKNKNKYYLFFKKKKAEKGNNYILYLPQKKKGREEIDTAGDGSWKPLLASIHIERHNVLSWLYILSAVMPSL